MTSRKKYPVFIGLAMFLMMAMAGFQTSVLADDDDCCPRPVACCPAPAPVIACPVPVVACPAPVRVVSCPAPAPVITCQVTTSVVSCPVTTPGIFRPYGYRSGFGYGFGYPYSRRAFFRDNDDFWYDYED